MASHSNQAAYPGVTLFLNVDNILERARVFLLSGGIKKLKTWQIRRKFIWCQKLVSVNSVDEK